MEIQRWFLSFEIPNTLEFTWKYMVMTGRQGHKCDNFRLLVVQSVVLSVGSFVHLCTVCTVQANCRKSVCLFSARCTIKLGYFISISLLILVGQKVYVALGLEHTIYSISPFFSFLNHLIFSNKEWWYSHHNFMQIQRMEVIKNLRQHRHTKQSKRTYPSNK